MCCYVGGIINWHLCLSRLNFIFSLYNPRCEDTLLLFINCVDNQVVGFFPSQIFLIAVVPVLSQLSQMMMRICPSLMRKMMRMKMTIRRTKNTRRLWQRESPIPFTNIGVRSQTWCLQTQHLGSRDRKIRNPESFSALGKLRPVWAL